MSQLLKVKTSTNFVYSIVISRSRSRKTRLGNTRQTAPNVTRSLFFAFFYYLGLQCYSCEGRENEMCGRDPTRANRVMCAANELCNVLRTERSDSLGKHEKKHQKSLPFPPFIFPPRWFGIAVVVDTF